ncbi:unnamed protein product [Urochloa humidicola]
MAQDEEEEEDRQDDSGIPTGVDDFILMSRITVAMPLRVVAASTVTTPVVAPLGLNVRRQKSTRPSKRARASTSTATAPRSMAAEGAGPATTVDDPAAGGVQPELVAQDLPGAEATPTDIDGKSGDGAIGLEDVDVPADMLSLEEVGDRGKRVEEERVLPDSLFQVGSSSAEEERALERALKEDREDVIAVTVASERLKVSDD